jgi:CubicO group peptidase (beta-lactamase class C family)
MTKHSCMMSSVCIFALLNAASCSTLYPRVDNQGQPQYEYVYHAPEETGDGWETSSLDAEGVDLERVKELIRNILNKRFVNIHSVLLVKNGKLVLEEYFYGYNRDKKHQLRSATKSVTSILVGIAKDQKRIKSVDEKLYESFPEYEEIDWSAPKNNITLKHVLTMTAGLDWNEWTYPDSDTRSSIYGMVRSDDWIEFVLKRRIVQSPGKIFNYSSGLSLVLGAILKNKTGLYANEYAEKYLFGPLGISDFSWQQGPNGMVYTSGGDRGLWLRPRDMAKIGLLFINKGNWKGQQIVSSEWVNESTKPHVNAFFAGSEYGYQWWRGEKTIGNRSIGVFYAAGHGGQYIFVCPCLDLVAVFTSKVHGNPLDVARPQIMMVDHIIPAILSLSPSQKNIESEPKLKSEYAGEHESKLLRVKLKIFEEGNGLSCKVFREKTKMLYESKNKFFGTLRNIGDVQFKFIRDEGGRVDKVITKIGFAILPFEKIE